MMNKDRIALYVEQPNLIKAVRKQAVKEGFDKEVPFFCKLLVARALGNENLVCPEPSKSEKVKEQKGAYYQANKERIKSQKKEYKKNK